MLFEFCKYISPMWYFNIASRESDNIGYFRDYTQSDSRYTDEIDVDNSYNSELATKCDAAYQILQKGLFEENDGGYHSSCNDGEYDVSIKRSYKDGDLKVNRAVMVSDVADNYRFARRFFGSTHALQILITRLLSFHNPVKELTGFIATKNVTKLSLYDSNGFKYYEQSYNTFDSPLIKSNPLVTVIIPTLNRYEYLKDVLIDLEHQDYKRFEVIVVDQSSPFNNSFYDGWNLDLTVIRQEEKALWLARNQAIKQSKGEYILLYDDDSRVDSDWILQHLKCIDYFKCDISSGVSISKSGDKVPVDYGYFKWSAQIDTGNVLFPKKLLRDTGMFDRQFEKERMGDGEFGLRAYLSGKKNISNPLAKRIHLKVSSGGLRQMGAWDAFQNKKLFAPRPIPSILYYCRKYYGDSIAKALLATTIPYSLMPYKYKGNNKFRLLSFLCFLVTFPIILIQVKKSWDIAGSRIENGDKIERYEN